MTDPVELVAEFHRAVGSLAYVAYGAAAAFGIPIREVFAEVHRANLAKIGPGGEVLERPDGKVIAPPGWKAPDVAGVLAAHARSRAFES